MRFTHLIDILYLMINYTKIDCRILIHMDIMCAQCSSLTLCESLSVAIFLMPPNVSDEWTKFFDGIAKLLTVPIAVMFWLRYAI